MKPEIIIGFKLLDKHVDELMQISKIDLESTINSLKEEAASLIDNNWSDYKNRAFITIKEIKNED